jgi:uncharacterized protein
MTKAHSRHSAAATTSQASTRGRVAKLYRVRRSPIHGTGVFAIAPIPKGTRVVEYLGDRVSHEEADRRYEDKAADDNHTFLFTVDDRIVIDAGVGGNEARWINHSCDPNCETVIEDKRVYIEAARDIASGQELAYDYMITREPGDPPDIEQVFACRCGAATCRGTMLLPPPKKRKKAARKSSRHGKAAPGAARSTKTTRTSKGTRKSTSTRKSTTTQAGRAPSKAPARERQSPGRPAAKRTKRR